MNNQTDHSKKISIILIDDNEVDNFINKEIIKRTHIAHTIQEYNTAVGALDYFSILLKEGKMDEMPEVIFLDINMPVMNGFEFLTRFKNIFKEFPSKTKVIMLTSSDNPDDISKVKEFPIVIDYLVKPLRPEKLSILKKMYS